MNSTSLLHSMSSHDCMKSDTSFPIVYAYWTRWNYLLYLVFYASMCSATWLSPLPLHPPFLFLLQNSILSASYRNQKWEVLILKMKNKTRTHISFYYLVMVQLFATPTIALPYFVALSLLRLVLTALILLIPYLDFNPSIILYQKACLAPQWSHKTSASIKKWKLQR